MNNVIIGTAGHVDHGKTCLIRALTGIDTDRLEEEKRRGITIELGFAYLDLPGGERAGIIDVPGHEKFIRNMLAGAGGIDIALLVIAADEGVMPQTREHMGILSLLDIKRGCVAVTKIDAVEEDWLELVLSDIQAELAGTVWEHAPILPVSAYTGAGMEDLRQTLFSLAADTAGKNVAAPFRLPVDRVFSMQGFGTVVTGTLIEGAIEDGQEVMIYPEGTLTRVRNIQVHGNAVERALAGQRVAVNLLKIKKEEIERGMVIAAPGSMHTSMMLDVALQVLPDSPRSIKNGSRLHFYHGAEEILCKAVLLGGVEEATPGQACYAQLRFEQPVATKAGDHFVVRFYSPIETVGGGTVLDPCPYKHKRASADAVGRLEQLHRGDAEARLEALLLEHSPHYRNTDFIVLQTTLRPEEFDQTLDRLVRSGRAAPLTEKVYLHRDYLCQLEGKLREFLRAYHAANPLKAGARREEVIGGLFAYVDKGLADKAIDYFAACGSIAIAGNACKLPDFSVAFTPRQEALRDTLLNIYRQADYAPPERAALAAEYGRDKDFPKVMDFLLDAGELVPADGELYFTKDCMEKAYAAFAQLHAQNGAVTLAEFRDAIGTSRKYAMAILDYWDKRGVTVKNGDARTLKR